MIYSAAKQGSMNTPCTNVPMHCPLCLASKSGTPRTIWKYNARYHIALEHADMTETAGSLPKGCLEQFMLDIHIRKDEERSLKIPADNTTRYRDRNNVLGSESLLEMIRMHAE
jgi:hypothetical protein